MDNKVILVTGSRKGIGRHLAEHYLAKGRPVIGFSREASDLKHTSYEHICVDVSDDKQVKQAFSTIRKKYGRLDVLINNAAVNPAISSFVLVPQETLKAVYGVNVFGLMSVCREGVKLMMKNKHGRIVNLSSMAVKHEEFGETVYTSSKAAVNSFTRVLAKEVYGDGITCNVLAPTAIPTDLSMKINQEALAQVLSRNAIKKFGRMEDVSSAIDWLIREESSAITGQILYLGGA